MQAKPCTENDSDSAKRVQETEQDSRNRARLKKQSKTQGAEQGARIEQALFLRPAPRIRQKCQNSLFLSLKFPNPKRSSIKSKTRVYPTLYR